MPEVQPSSRSCFVCGRENALGLHARWIADRERGEVRSETVVGEAFNGYPGVVHGGIVTALLDEAMARTALLAGGFEDLLVTGRITVTFRQPTPTGQPIVVAARITRRSGSRSQAEAEIRLADGTVTAQAEALMTRPPPEVAAAWAEERKHWRVDG
ncbi:MAG: PaaI family thioesterase [Deltaproteobacteria bacterium]|nr:PaaI family thioesterase [Deltaproteobacteria bacterium]